ncbi:MAG TPA: hypothetical protein VIZ60_04485 [Rubrobacter sp.]
MIHHTDCGMLTFSDDELKAQIHEEVGLKPHFSMESFSDLEEDVRQSMARIQASPFVPHKESVRGFVYEVETGRLRDVTLPIHRSAWKGFSQKFVCRTLHRASPLRDDERRSKSLHAA